MRAVANCVQVGHPLVQSKLAVLRDRATSVEAFRRTLREISLMVGYEALRDLPVDTVTVETPLAESAAVRIARPIIFAPILRAGLGMADAMTDLVPDGLVGHIGMFRNETTHEPEQYYLKLPSGLDRAEVVVVDPMLATGNSAASALDLLKQAGAQHLRMVCLLACPEGIARLAEKHPDVRVFTAAIDDHLNENAYIVPGLGDAGDRYFGTL